MWSVPSTPPFQHCELAQICDQFERKAERKRIVDAFSLFSPERWCMYFTNTQMDGRKYCYFIKGVKSRNPTWLEPLLVYWNGRKSSLPSITTIELYSNYCASFLSTSYSFPSNVQDILSVKTWYFIMLPAACLDLKCGTPSTPRCRRFHYDYDSQYCAVPSARRYCDVRRREDCEVKLLATLVFQVYIDV